MYFLDYSELMNSSTSQGVYMLIVAPFRPTKIGSSTLSWQNIPKQFPNPESLFYYNLDNILCHLMPNLQQCNIMLFPQLKPKFMKKKKEKKKTKY